MLKFTGSARFMASYLLIIADNFSERIHKIKRKYGHHNKKCEAHRIKYKICNCFLTQTLTRI